MAVTIVCGACGTPALIHELVTTCPKCSHQLPAVVKRDIELGLLEQKARRPFLLRLGEFLSGASAVSSLGAIAYMLRHILPRGFEFGDLPPLLVALVSALGCGAIAIGLHRERPWTRRLMIAFWPLLGAALAWRNAVPLGGPLIWHAMIFAVPTAVAAAYLYRLPAVRRYYRLLQLQSGDATPAPPDDELAPRRLR